MGCGHCELLTKTCGKKGKGFKVDLSGGGSIFSIPSDMDKNTMRFGINHPVVPLDHDATNTDQNNAATAEFIGMNPSEPVQQGGQMVITAPIIFVGVLAIMMAAMIVICIGFIVRRDVAPVSPDVVNYGKVEQL